MKKLLSLVLALAMLLTCTAVFAENAPALPLAGKLVILHTNDIHGRGMATDDQLGYARIAAMRQNIPDLGGQVLLLDAGDFSQGTPLVNLSQGAAAVEFMNAAGYDAATVGNHEFDWGTDNLLQATEKAEFPVLCANLTYKTSGETVFPANKVFELGDVKVGVFGLATPETMTKAHPDKVKGVTFAMGEELYAVAQAQADELKNAGCDVIVALGHLGVDDESAPNRSIDVLENVTGIDLFIDGHSHTTIDGGKQVGDTLLTSTGSYSDAIGYVIVEVAKSEEGVSKSFQAGLYRIADELETELATTKKLPIDDVVDATVTLVNNDVEDQLGATFAKAEVTLDGNRAPGVRTQETNLGDFSADAILWAAKNALGEDQVQAALTNGGGIRESIPAGDITMKTMKTVFPFGNEVAVLTVTGAELLEALEAATYATPDALGAFPQVAGIVFTVDTSVPYENGEMYPDSTYYAPAKPGARVTIESVGGEPFNAEALYTIATNDFTAAGGDTYYAFKYSYETSGYKTGVALEDALVQYTQQVLNGVVGEQYAEPQGRITIK